jgi:hypothetical protein
MLYVKYVHNINIIITNEYYNHFKKYLKININK